MKLEWVREMEKNLYMPKKRKRKEKEKAIQSLVFVKQDHYVEKKLKMNHYVTPSLGKEGQQQLH